MIEITEARQRGRRALDLTVALPPSAGEAAEHRLDTVERAERLAEENVLLSPPRGAELAACRRWYLSQITTQLAGGCPTPWREGREG